MAYPAFNSYAGDSIVVRASSLEFGSARPVPSIVAVGWPARGTTARRPAARPEVGTIASPPSRTPTRRAAFHGEDEPIASPRTTPVPRPGLLAPADIAGAILVVDDDTSIRAAIRDVLELEGYRVLTAANGAEALAILERGLPALVLLDMRMPVLDGWGLAAALRARGIAVPICVMTAAQDTARWAREIGADGYLAKPFNLVDLLDEIGRIIDG